MAAAQQAGLRLFQGCYPITPASDILHELSMYKNFGVITFQAEDEIAAITSAIGAAYAGALAITSDLGPRHGAQGRSASGSRSMVELPLVIVDIQRGGPSTGLPTKTEQADLFQALFGRNSEAPVPVVAAVVARRLLLDGARGVPHRAQVHGAGDPALGRLHRERRRAVAHAGRLRDCRRSPSSSAPTPRASARTSASPDTLARPWAVPGTPGLEHRIGGLEKEDVTGNVNYDPLNHERMVQLRAAKVAAIADDIPDAVPAGDPDGELLVVGWGSTYGAITARCARSARRATASATPTCGT